MREIIEISLNDIKPNKAQPRLAFYENSLNELASSIEVNGLLQPIVVRKKDNYYELIAGERRYRAFLLLGREKIPAIVEEKDDQQSADLALIENMQRENLSAIEEAKAMQHIIHNEGITQNELAKRLGYKQSTVANKLRLLRLSDDIKESMAKGELSERHARALLKINENERENVAKTIIERDYTVKETEEYINELLNKDKKKIKGVSSSIKIGVNTIRQAYELCRKSGLDASLSETDYENEIKLVIRFKK